MMDIQKIETLPALDDLLAKSKETPVWVFKHSLTCPISGAAWSEFRRFAANASQQARGDLRPDRDPEGPAGLDRARRAHRRSP